MTTDRLIPLAEVPTGLDPVDDFKLRVYERIGLDAVNQVDSSGVSVVSLSDPSRVFFNDLPFIKGRRYAATFELPGTGQVNALHYPDVAGIKNYFVIPARTDDAIDFELIFTEGVAEVGGVAVVTPLGPSPADRLVTGWTETDVLQTISYQFGTVEFTENWVGKALVVPTGAIGVDHELGILTYLRANLRRTVLEASFGWDFTGLDALLPDAFVAGTRDELCPILDERWVDLESNEAIGQNAPIDPFSAAELRGGPLSGTLTVGAGYMVVTTGDLPGATQIDSGLGEEGSIAVDSPLVMEISVPSGLGKGQLTLYTEILARVLKDVLIPINDFSHLENRDEPPLNVTGEKVPGWLRGSAEIPFLRIQRLRSALAVAA